MRIPTQKGSSGTRPSTIRTLPYNCERCRRDKTKCDKTWPKCRRCVRKGYKCVCVATKRGRPSKSSKENANARMLVPNKRKRTLGPEFFLNMQMQTPQQPRGASSGTNNSTTLAPGGMDAMDILHSAASMELLAEQARQAAEDKNTLGIGGQVMQQEALANMHQPSTLQGRWQTQHLSNNSPYYYPQTNAVVAMHNMQQDVQKNPVDTSRYAKGVARSILLSNMWVYFRSNDYEGISNGYKAAKVLNLDFPDFCKNCHDMMSAMNMRGAFAYQAGTSIVPDTVVKQEIIKLSQAVENTTYPCVYFCNLYGHSFHVTNTKMRNFLCSSDSQANIAATFMERRPFSNAAGKQTDPTLHCGKEAAAPPTHSPFKTMIGSMLNCDAKRKEEIINTFMGNSLLKSDRALMSYWSNMPPVPSFQTTFTYERIPILDYNSLVPMQTTLLVDLSRSVNGETFLHKIYFTNIQPRVVEPLSETTTVQGLSRLPNVSLSATSHSESKEACRTNKDPSSTLLGHQFQPESSTTSQTVL